MSVTKIKSVAIAALALINLLFLSVIIIDSVEDARIKRQMLENACAVLQSNGIIVYPANVIAIDSIRLMRTARSHETEAGIARTLLGPVEMTDLGVIFRYDNEERGSAEFSSAGEFLVVLNEGVITASTGSVRAVQSLLREMRIETSELVVSGTVERETVTAVVTFRGASIFNCIIEFDFVMENLETIRGRYVTGIESAEDGIAISSPETALLGFLAAARRDDMNCSRINSIEAGYHFRTSGPFGDGVIAPAWLITTDTGRYIMDDATGEIEFVSV